MAQNHVRSAPIVFDKAHGSEIFDETGNRYIDFHGAGGSLSFGHNNRKVRGALIDYLRDDRVIQAADRASVSKRRFLEQFVTTILQPRQLNYHVLFTDPAAGAAAEAALRLARRHRNRATVIAFTNSSHALAEGFRSNTVFMPYCGYLGEDYDTIAYLRRYLEDSASGVQLPAAVIVETVQVHGGVRIASAEWLKALAQLCREFEILLIADETHSGCGMTGPYFSFERAALKPDMVLVSNAIAGGLPMSILLLRPELDHWRAGEQVGAFQGNGLAFVAATEILTQWNDEFSAEITRRGRVLADEFQRLLVPHPRSQLRVRGCGMIWGLDFGRPAAAMVVSAWALEHGVIVEPARIRDEVLLVTPPTTTEDHVLMEGLHRLNRAVSMFINHK